MLLLKFNFAACFFESCLDLFCFILGDFLLDDCVRSLVDEFLRLFQSEAGEFLDGLHHLEFGLTSADQDHVECALLGLGRCTSGAFSGDDDCSGCRFDAIFVFEDLCKFLDFFYGKVNKFFRKSFDVCNNYWFFNCFLFYCN